MYLYFSIGNGQPREPALCQLYRHTFVPYRPSKQEINGILEADNQVTMTREAIGAYRWCHAWWSLASISSVSSLLDLVSGVQYRPGWMWNLVNLGVERGCARRMRRQCRVT